MREKSNPKAKKKKKGNLINKDNRRNNPNKVNFSFIPF